MVGSFDAPLASAPDWDALASHLRRQTFFVFLLPDGEVQLRAAFPGAEGGGGSDLANVWGRAEFLASFRTKRGGREGQPQLSVEFHATDRVAAEAAVRRLRLGDVFASNKTGAKAGGAGDE